MGTLKTGIKKAIYPGTFDPFTNGHLDIVRRSLSTFDEMTILVARSERKASLFSADERVTMIRQTVAHLPGVTVECWDGLVVEYAKKMGACALVRGLRAASDFEYEFMMAAMNRELCNQIETFFMMTGENLYFVSSSMVKELFRFGGDVSPYLPPNINEELKKKKGQNI